MRLKTYLQGVLILMLLASTQATAQSFDLLIKHGRLLDGSGNPWHFADVAIQGDRIVAVGDLEGSEAARVLDARGLYVAPGFIDVHSHAGPGLATRPLSGALPLLKQGITTIMINPDGGGPVDLPAQRKVLLADGLGVNVAQLVPHGSVRRRVMDMADHPPNGEELERMKSLVRAGMKAGAFGLSSGLFYAPGSYAATEEVVELAKVAAEFGGVYTSHIRDEADYNIGLVGAVEEVITIAKEAGLPGIITHIKALGPRVWGYSTALVKRIQGAREQGVEVYADQYPYQASGTSITGALVPRWAQVGGREALLRRIGDSQARLRLRADMLANLARRGGAERLQFRSHPADPSIEGKTLQQVARERDTDPIDLAMKLLKAGGAGLVSFNMDPDDVATLMRQDWVMTCSDGGLVPTGRGVPHPRNYGTFPRKIHKYVLQEKVLGLAQAIRSMTSLPAAVFGVHDRGRIQPGALADLVVFDLESIRDRATYRKPHQLSEGIVYLLVNGKLALDQGRPTGKLNGRVLSHRPR
ncbi:MAG: amidohydrolase family protein [Acidobacteriota bacterium]